MRSLDLSFQIKATGPDLTVIARLDGIEHHRLKPGLDWVELAVPFDDDQEGDHVLEIELADKLPQHTQLDAQGEIIQDRVIELRAFSLDGIDLGEEFFGKITYQHDFNGTQDPITDGFYGIMGCNGCLSVRFQSPIYVWLLEQM